MYNTPTDLSLVVISLQLRIYQVVYFGEQNSLFKS